jgi:hypothetical protein
MGLKYSLAGLRVTQARVYLHAWGAWYADVSVDGEHALSGAVALVLNDATFRGTVLSGGASFGRSDFRIVGGAGGWGKILPKRSYANDAGVKLASVVADAARECGETFDASTAPAGARLGPAWTRPSGPACRVLEQVSPSSWYVDEAGVTKLGRRAATTYSGKAARVSPLDRSRRRLVLAAEDFAPLVPGVVVDGLEAIDVLHSVDSETGARTTIYGKGIATASKLLDAYRKMLDQLDPDRLFRGTFEYRVVSLEGNRANLQPVLVSTGMPDLQRVPVRSGLSGAKSQLALGSRVLLTWVNADPARPEVVAFEDADGEGFRPVITEIDAQNFVKLGAGLLPVARQGDLAGGIFPVVTTQIKVKS